MEKTRQDSKNPLKGALTLFTASTSSWWKSKQREDLANGGTCSGSCLSVAPGAHLLDQQRSNSGDSSKWPSSNGTTTAAAMASPLVERRWAASAGLGTPIKDSAWATLTPERQPPPPRTSSNSNGGRKWATPVMATTAVEPSGNGSNQDRKWRSLGALLRTPVTGNSPAAESTSQSRSSQTSGYHHNASASMIEDSLQEYPKKAPNGGYLISFTNKYPPILTNYRPRNPYNLHPASTSKLMSKSTSNGEYSLSSGRTKVGRKLFQQMHEDLDRELDEEIQLRAEAKDNSSKPNSAAQRMSHNGVQSQDNSSAARSARAQSFYLLDDFLRPQPQMNGVVTNGINSKPSSSGDHYVSYRNGIDGSNLATAVPASATVAASSNGPRNVTNITPPRRHNSSSDSLEVATSPLPPPVPPPPPQISSGSSGGTREREKPERNYSEKELCRCRMCWSGFQQKSMHDEVSLLFFSWFFFIFSGLRVFFLSVKLSLLQKKGFLTVDLKGLSRGLSLRG